MPETLILSEQGPEIQRLVKRVASARRVAVVTGAGISVNCGIPDFRSSSGLFRQIQQAHGDVVSKGRDLFDASVVFRTAQTASVFYAWMTHLRQQCAQAEPGVVHGFIRKLADRGQLLRSYTQNIDGLERKAGLSVWDPHCTPDSADYVPWQHAHSIPLHGSMDRLTCQLCASSVAFAAHPGRMAGDACADCVQRSQEREQSGRRALPAGKLRPTVVLYEEPHPHSEDIARIIGHDTRALGRAKNDVLLVFGTTLKVPGCRQLVRQLAAAPNTTTVLVNNEPVCGRAWDGVVDYQIIGCVDDWCARVQRVWNAQTKITQWTTPRKSSTTQSDSKKNKIAVDTKKENAGGNALLKAPSMQRKRRALDTANTNDGTDAKQPERKRRRAALPARRSARIATRESLEHQQQSLSICT
ncbi:NAD-dependent deacetylase hst3 [Coemansia erecta]|nr:NAD-dependent deacetylase hst3 [Coemansia sp. RSA 2618]KAJ2824787.1 NAD-dependent deacetylase hst3 [Coemansia erecta]